jgi:preprotein translocase subunit SecA
MDERPGWLDRTAANAVGAVVRAVRGRRRGWGRLLSLVEAEGRSLAGAGSARFSETATELRVALRRGGLSDELVARGFALVREVAQQTIGQRHFDVQVLGGHVLLQGMIAEMETGEGKTLTATLPACVAALAGIPVHVITVNDYLTQRDADWMRPIYRALGLSVGVVVHGQDPAARQAAYAADVTYCTNKELTFDYLRDRIVLGRQPSRIHLQLERLYGEAARSRRLLLRGLHYAIVDEADSVLVDEARTPLIISGGGGAPPGRETYEQAIELARRLVAGEDFVLEERERSVRITDAGRGHLAQLVAPLGGVWTGQRRREELARQALTALHLFHRDRQYMVVQDKVQIVDEYTGRTMPDRSWEQGLHQLIEAKEGVALTAPLSSQARISYQRFFRRYRRLAGMTGTAAELARELWSVYRLVVVRVPTNRRLRRVPQPERIYATADAKWWAIVDRVRALHAEQRPVLIGTRSVAASESLSALLAAEGLRHSVLNARQDHEEAAIVARAGAPGQITVATNMAGRGTDITLGEGVASRGGLHVIATERHEARRIDRQLFGRCGRQGDPGSYEAVVSLEDELVSVYGSPWRALALRLALRSGRVPRWIGRFAVWRAQRVAQRLHARMRRDLLRADERLETTLAFSGRFE